MMLFLSQNIIQLFFKTLLLVQVALIARTVVFKDRQLVLVSSLASPPYREQLVLFISFDGFRWDYLQKTNTPNFDQLTKTGVEAEFVYDAFITKTFPNHYTMVTGLYEESHGIIGNYMYDPDLDQVFKIGSNSTQDPVWWKDGEPIWISNQKQGGQSGVINYVGSDVKIRGTYPTYHLPKYDGDMPYHERVDRLIHLFANGSINLGVLYFEEPDHSGHLFGPDSVQMLPVIRKCDEVVGYIIDQLKKIDIYDKINIVISADHGMTEVTPKKSIFLEDYIQPDCCRLLENNPLVMIWPHNDSDVNSIYHTLVDAHPNLNVYLKEEIPVQYHYNSNSRIPPILVVGQDHWQVFVKKQIPNLRGEHGYNNSLMNMHPFFVAHGPAFKQGYRMAPFRIVDLYPLLCNLLGIKPSVNNGSLEEVKLMLKGGDNTQDVIVSTQTTEKPIYTQMKESLSMDALIGLGTACFVALVAMFLLVAMCVRQRSYRQHVYEYTPIEDTSLEGQQALAGPHASYFYPNTKI